MTTEQGKIYWVFASEHHTKHEGAKSKVHISNDHGFVLCGVNPNQGGGTGGEVTLDWVNQPDPDNQICKTCKKIFIKLKTLNPNG